MSEDVRWLAHAVELATANVADGGGPFAALVVQDGVVVSTGQNRVTRDLDPTAHAEVTAIRDACRAVGAPALSGHTLYSSCEPCPLCLSACLWARLDRVVYSADREDAARGGFDDGVFYELMSQPRSVWPMAVEVHRTAAAAEPFDAWLAKEDRAEY
jgi:guanine deaminase